MSERKTIASEGQYCPNCNSRRVISAITITDLRWSCGNCLVELLPFTNGGETLGYKFKFKLDEKIMQYRQILQAFEDSYSGQITPEMRINWFFGYLETFNTPTHSNYNGTPNTEGFQQYLQGITSAQSEQAAL